MKNAGDLAGERTAKPAAPAVPGGLPAPEAAEPAEGQPEQVLRALLDQQGDGQHGTRNRVARSILDHGPSTAADLADRLTLTPAAVRRHLDALVAEGVVKAREKRIYGQRGRGRPAKVFALTDSGRDAFYQAYDQLAVEAMHWIARCAGGGDMGAAAIGAFARARMTAWAERYRAAVQAAQPQDRTKILARELSGDGYAATARSVHPATASGRSRRPIGEQLCQRHCPVVHVAEQFPQLCEAETEIFSHLLGTHVQRLATIAHGDGVCTTFVPPSRIPPGQVGGRHGRDGPGTGM